MAVSAVTVGGNTVDFAHRSDRLRIPLTPSSRAGTEIAVTVQYSGVPAQGLRLINNIHGERTVFSDSWPNLARQWLPTIDHPYDKATGEFIVTAPAHYQVVANGVLRRKSICRGGLRRTHWKQSVPIASWLFALGVGAVCRPSLRRRPRRPAAGVGVSAGSRQGVRHLRADRAQGIRVLQRPGRALLVRKARPRPGSGRERRHGAGLVDFLRREERRGRARAGRARSGPSVVRQLRHREGLGRCVAERGIRDLLHALVRGAVQRTRRVRARPEERRRAHRRGAAAAARTSRSSTATSRT